MLAIVVAAAGIVAITWALWRPTTLRAAASDSAGGAARVATSAVSVIVPARNEAANLTGLLDSLARSAARPHEVIVVDDGSTDGTAVVAGGPGATVIPAGALPSGWAGKPHACAVGAARSNGSVLVFLDADVRLSPDALGLVAALLATRRGLVSVQPEHRPGSVVEQLSAVFNVCAVAGSGGFTPHAGGASRVAFGPCLAISRDDYAAVGGHAGVAGSVIEDVALARAVAAEGRPVSVVLGGADVTFRMYPTGWRAMVQGWTKNIAVGAASAPPLPVLATVVWVAAMVATAISTVDGVARWAAGAAAPVAALVAYAAVALHAVWVLRLVGRFRRVTALAFPVPVLFFVLVFVRSSVLALLRRPVRWRGRTVASRQASR